MDDNRITDDIQYGSFGKVPDYTFIFTIIMVVLYVLFMVGIIILTVKHGVLG